MAMTKPSLLLLAALVFVTTERDPSVTVIQSVTDEVGGRSRSETRLAISGSCRGQHLGAILLLDALYRSWRNTSRVASIGVIVGALVDNARAV